MDKNQTLRKDLIEAWERYVDDSYTCDDLALILDSTMNDEYIQEFKEVADRKWEKSMNNMQPTPEEKEIYRKKFAQFFTEYERKSKNAIIQESKTIVRFRKVWYAAAAALLLAILIPAAYQHWKPKIEQFDVQYIEVMTQRGEIRNIVLPDQTMVTLNAESRLIYPDHFTDYERSVELHGEALFEVVSDHARPFMVKTKNMNIRVLGTVFDVKEYEVDVTSSVSVATGKVEVGLADGKVMLEQNQQVKMNKTTGNFEKLTIDAGNFLSWTNGILYFDRTPIREVVNILNRYYPQTKIELVEGEFSNMISGEYDNKLVEVVLTSICYSTKLKCTKQGNQYVLYQ